MDALRAHSGGTVNVSDGRPRGSIMYFCSIPLQGGVPPGRMSDYVQRSKLELLWSTQYGHR